MMRARSALDTAMNQDPGREQRRRLTIGRRVRLTYWFRSALRHDSLRVALVHGAASNHTRWSELLETSELLQACDTLRPDMRGNGESIARGRLDLDVWADDLQKMLDLEGARRAILVGHSLGAQIALRLAADAPERVRGLVLIDPVFRRALRGGHRTLCRLEPLIRAAVLAIRALNACGIRRRRFPARDLRELDRRTREELRTTDDPEAIANKYTSLQPILRSMPTANYLQQMLAIVAPLPPLESIDVPILVLMASGSGMSDPSIVREELARFPDAHVVPIDADHWPLTEKPDEVRAAIERWLRERSESIGA